MKTLYISDLDGTLLRPDMSISDYSASVIERFVNAGGNFTYATARSITTALKVAGHLNLKLPVINFNGTFITDADTRKIISYESFGKNEIIYLEKTINSFGAFPVVFSFIDGIEKVSWLEGYETEGIKHYIRTRKGDKRFHPVKNRDDLYYGNVFYIACMDLPENILELKNAISADGRYNIIWEKDIYSNVQWCEFMPKNATKAKAAEKLKNMLGCEHLIVFGDGINDLPLFEIADECYAVANAVPELKERASGIIESNWEDGVAKCLEKMHFKLK